MLVIHNEDGFFRIFQPHLIDIMIDSVPGLKDVRSANSPSSAGVILTKEINGESRKEHWNYRSVIGLLNCLVNCTHPEISYAVY